MPIDAGSAVGYLDLDISGFLNGLKTAQAEADKSVKNIATDIGNKMQGIGNNLSSAGKKMSAVVTTPIVGLGTGIIKTSADFESAMSKVSAVSGATGSDFDALKAKAREMGSSTKFSATESAEAMNYMAMAGWKTQDMIDGIDGIMNLAAADGLDLATTSDIVTDALTAFGLSASDSSHFADVLAKASSSANTNVSMLGESFKYVAPVAGSLGYSVEDTSIALGLMANAGIKASQGGTALRSMLTNLAKPTDDIKDAMDYLGISLQNSDGSMKSLGEVMQNLRSSFGQCKMPMDEFQKQLQEIETKYQSGEMTEKKYNEALEDLTEKAYGAEGALKAKYASTIAGKEAMSGLLAIVSASDSDYENLTNSIYNADGAAKQMADTMNDNLSGQITTIRSKLEELALQFGEILLPYVKKFAEKLDNLIVKMQKLTPEQKEQIAKWALIAAAIGPVLLVVGKLFTGIGTLVTVLGNVPSAIGKAKTGLGLFKTSLINVKEAIQLTKAGFPGMAGEASKLGAALGGITAPMVAIGVAIGVLVGAFATLMLTNEDFRNKMSEIWNQIKETVSEFCEGIVERINALGFDFSSVTEILGGIWKGFCDLLAPVFESAFQLVADTLEAVLGIITGLLDVFIGLFTGNWEQLWTGVKEIFGSVWELIKDIFSNALEMLKGIFDTVCRWFGTTWEETWTKIKEFFSETWENIREFFLKIGEKISKAFSDFVEHIAEKTDEFVETIKESFTNLSNKVKNIFDKIVKNAKEFGSEMKNKAVTAGKNFVESVINFVKNLPNRLKNVLDKTINNVINFSNTMKNKAVECARNTYDSIVNGLINLPDRMLEIGSNIVQGIWNGIASGASWLYNQIYDFASGIVDSMMGALGIHSPSTVMRDKVGKFMPLGIAEGFKKQLPNTIKDMKEQLYKGVDNLQTNLGALKIKGIEIVGGDDLDIDDFGGIGGNNGFDYQTFAWYMLDILKKAPIQVPVSVEMQDGDVIIDKERVGRKVAPVVSRVLTQS